MAQSLDPAGLDGHAKRGVRVPGRAHLALLGCLADHDRQLVGNDGVEDGDDHHGEHERRKGVDLRREGSGKPVRPTGGGLGPRCWQLLV